MHLKKGRTTLTYVKFATLCTIPLPTGSDRLICHARSEEYTEWPECRVCGAHVCPDHTVPGSLQEHDFDRESEDGTEAVHTEDVYCVACLKENGPEESDTPSPNWCVGCDNKLPCQCARPYPAHVKLIKNGAEEEIDEAEASINAERAASYRL